MAVTASVNQAAQFGTETTPGTPVAAGKSFTSTTVTIGPKIETDKIRPSGSKFASTTFIKKEWTEGNLEGVPCWNEMPGFLTWVCGTASNTDNADGTYTHAWTLGAGKTRTIEYGDSTAAAEAPGCFVKSFELNWGRNSGDAQVSAEIVGGYWTSGITLTADPVAYESSPIEAHTVSVYADDDLEDIGTTLLADALRVSFKTGDIRQPVWTLDASQASFSDRVEVALDNAEIELLLEANAAGRAFLDSVRTKATKYIRIVAEGAAIGSGAGVQTLRIDLAVKATDYTQGDEDNVYAVTVPLTVVEDASGFSHGFAMIDTSATAL